MHSVSPTSFIPTVAGVAMVWTAIWLAGPLAVAAVITVGMLTLAGGSVAAGIRRASEGPPTDPEQEWATYRTMRQGAIFSALAIPFICVMWLIYVDSSPARALGAAGLALLWISGIRNQRDFLAHLQDRAQRADASQVAANRSGSA